MVWCTDTLGGRLYGFAPMHRCTDGLHRRYIHPFIQCTAHSKTHRVSSSEMEMPAFKYASSSSRPETRSNSKVVHVLKISGSGLKRTVVPLRASGPCGGHHVCILYFWRHVSR